LLTRYLWTLHLVNIYITMRIQLFKWLIEYLARCQRHRLTFIILLRDMIHPPIPTM
jgi:hypothetical protein